MSSSARLSTMSRSRMADPYYAPQRPTSVVWCCLADATAAANGRQLVLPTARLSRLGRRGYRS